MQKSTSLSHVDPPNASGWPSQPPACRWVNSPLETWSPGFHHPNKYQPPWNNSSENCMYQLEHQKTLDEARCCPYQLNWSFMGGKVLKKQVWTSYSGTRESRGWREDIPGTVSTSQLGSLTVSTPLCAAHHHPSWPWLQPPPTQATQTEKLAETHCLWIPSTQTLHDWRFKRIQWLSTCGPSCPAPGSVLTAHSPSSHSTAPEAPS